MARPIWNGMLSFGLLNVPVQLYSAERSTEEIQFRMLDSRNNAPVKYQRVNAESGEEVPWKDIVKAYEYSKGNYVLFDPEEIKKLAPEATETVEIEAFVPRDSISPVYFERPYYLIPGKKAEKGYVLLRDVLRKTNQAGIAKVVIRTKQYLAALFPVEDALVVTLMRFAEEIVPMEEFEFPGEASEYRVSAKELQMAGELIESMATKWTPDEYRDDFRDKMRKLIDARVAEHTGKKVTIEEEERTERDATTNVVDFMALLKKSLEKKGKQAKQATAKQTTAAKSEKPKARKTAAAKRSEPAPRRGRGRATHASAGMH